MAALRDLVQAGALTLRWRTAQDNKVCDDCSPRHDSGGLTLEQWTREGLPGTGWSQCKGNCRCQLIPEGVVQVGDNDTLDPIDFGRIRREVPGDMGDDDRFRIAANRRRMARLGLETGVPVIYRSSRFVGFDGMRGVIEEITDDSLVVRFEVAPGLPEFQTLRIFEFSEVVRADG